MNRFQILKFVGISISCCMSMIFFLYSTMDTANTFKNGFNRTFKLSHLMPINVLNLDEDGYYISGSTDNTVYLSHINWPFRVIAFEKCLRDSQMIKLQFPKIKSHWNESRLVVDSPAVYSCDGMMPTFYSGDLNSKTMSIFTKKTSYYTAAVNLSHNSFAVRAIDAKTKSNTFYKIQLDTPFVKRRDHILTKQVDGIFCTDGKLKFDKQSNKVFYLYYYRNQYMVLDTNLNIIRTSNTIDTNTVAKISIANVSKNGEYKFSTPPTIVNGAFCIKNDRIFIRSALQADNEPRSALKRYNVIDVYDLNTGRYIQSFYTEKIGRESIVDMQIVGKSLVALFNKHLVVYDLPNFL